MYSSDHCRKLVFALGVAIIATAPGMAGPLEPPPGPVTSTGRFGPRVDVATLPGDATATRVISQPGSYYISGTLTGVAGKAGIRIDASQVTLDLGGFSLVGVGGSLNGITTDARAQVSIHNGSVINWGGNGIRAINGYDIKVREVMASGNGGWGIEFIEGGVPSSHVSVVQCIVRANTAGGITASDWVTVSNTQVNLNQGDGIVVNSAGSILDNLVSDNTGTGISCGFSSCLIRGNTVTFNGAAINAPGSTIVDNNP